MGLAPLWRFHLLSLRWLLRHEQIPLAVLTGRLQELWQGIKTESQRQRGRERDVISHKQYCLPKRKKALEFYWKLKKFFFHKGATWLLNFPFPLGCHRKIEDRQRINTLLLPVCFTIRDPNFLLILQRKQVLNFLTVLIKKPDWRKIEAWWVDGRTLKSLMNLEK